MQDIFGKLEALTDEFKEENEKINKQYEENQVLGRKSAPRSDPEFIQINIITNFVRSDERKDNALGYDGFGYRLTSAPIGAWKSNFPVL